LHPALTGCLAKWSPPKACRWQGTVSSMRLGENCILSSQRRIEGPIFS